MFIVLELWEPAQGETPQTVTYSRATKEEAMSSYHYILSQAAVSNHYKHGAIVMQTDGKYIARECYEHMPEESEES